MSKFYINRACLLGNLTKDAELRYTQSGNAVLTINMATNHSVKNQDGSYKDIPTFHRVIIWGKMAEYLSKNLSKGTKIYVEGRITTREYEDKNGQKQRSREIIAENAIPMTGKRLEAKPTDTEEPQEENVNSDDIPF